MRLAFTGTIHVPSKDLARALISSVILAYRPTVIVTGSSRGVESLVTDVAEREFNLHVHRVESSSDSESGIRHKYRRMINGCDVLVRILGRTGPRLYSHIAVELANRANKPVIDHNLAL
jgi:hypothetical protein